EVGLEGRVPALADRQHDGVNGGGVDGPATEGAKRGEVAPHVAETTEEAGPRAVLGGRLDDGIVAAEGFLVVVAPASVDEIRERPRGVPGAHDDVREVDRTAGRAGIFEHEPEGHQLRRRVSPLEEPDVRGRAAEDEIQLARAERVELVSRRA